MSAIEAARPVWRRDLSDYVRSGAFAIHLGLAVLVAATALWSLTVGAVAVSPRVVLNTLFALDGEKQTYIVMTARLPRTVLALVTGASLAVAGAIIQAIIRNPLASPKIVGINSGAALATLLGIVLFPDLPIGYLPVTATAGGIIAALIILVAAHRRQLSGTHLALVGIAFGFLCEAGVDYILVTSPSYELTTPLVWLTGSFWGRGWAHVAAVQWPLIALMAAGLALSYRLDLLHLGRATATGLGVSYAAERFALLMLATVLASVAVGVVGVLGFVGLIAPHIARRLTGGSHRRTIPTAALVGMLLVVLADAAGRAIAPPIEVPAGILSAVFGAPFFIYVMLTSTER